MPISSGVAMGGGKVLQPPFPRNLEKNIIFRVQKLIFCPKFSIFCDYDYDYIGNVSVSGEREGE